MTPKFCTNCGNRLDEGARFCTGCGRPIAVAPPSQPPAPPPPPPQPVAPEAAAPAPVTPVETASTFEDEDFDPPPTYRRFLPMAIAGFCVAALLIVAALLLFRGDGEEGTANDETLAASNETAAEGREAGYQDVFFSDGDETLRVLSTANVRDRPTSDGTTVTRELGAGEEVTGRWVQGIDQTMRWLRIEEPQGAGYIPEGSLGQIVAFDNIFRADPNGFCFRPTLATAFGQMMVIQRAQNQADTRVVAGRPFRMAGVPFELRPELVYGGPYEYDVRLPLTGTWHGLRLEGVFLSGFIDGGGNAGVILNEPLERVIETLDGLGFNLGPDGRRVVVPPHELTMQATEHEGQTTFSCGGH